jgi:hypothetical protein
MAEPNRQNRRPPHRNSPDFRLQPLRMGTGWKVAWNQFYELDPPRDWERDVETVFFSEDRLLLQHQQRRVLVSLDWMPYGPKGRFVLRAVNWVGDTEMPASWDRPLLQLRTRSRARVVQTLDRWLDDEFDWSAVKRKRPARNARNVRSPKQTCMRTQKLYESLE